MKTVQVHLIIGNTLENAEKPESLSKHRYLSFMELLEMVKWSRAYLSVCHDKYLTYALNGKNPSEQALICWSGLKTAFLKNINRFRWPCT